ncbi:hypothetical protein [Streptococcus halotolerans]|nr:hypothetical protein [Streptococcus halotolerans]
MHTIADKKYKGAAIRLMEKQSEAIVGLQAKGRKAADIEGAINQ